MRSVMPKVVPFPTTPLRAFLRSLCPRCRSGRIFASFLAMNPECPSCGLVFEREPGYFSGALLISHLAGLPMIVLLAGITILGLGPDASIPLAILLATLSFTALSPFLCRVARVLWIHLDQNLDPARRPYRSRRRVGIAAARGTAYAPRSKPPAAASVLATHEAQCHTEAP